MKTDVSLWRTASAAQDSGETDRFADWAKFSKTGLSNESAFWYDSEVSHQVANTGWGDMAAKGQASQGGSAHESCVRPASERARRLRMGRVLIFHDSQTGGSSLTRVLRSAWKP